MGINIFIYNGHDVHPDWDWVREANDSEFPALFDGVELLFHPELTEHFRPVDLDLIRAKIKLRGWENKGRYLRLIDLLEQYEDYFLYFSF